MSAHAEAIRASATRAPLYAYWHLSSLDAPTVAVVWSCAFAASASVKLPLYAPLALALVTWTIYVGDRLLDVRRAQRGGCPGALRDRHWFHARHAPALLAGLGAAALTLAWVVVRGLSDGIIRRELFLAAFVIVYFAAIHLPVSRLAALRQSPSKEAIVGLIFSFAVAIPAATFALHPADQLIPALCFAALCGLNCLAIESAEGPDSDRADSMMQCELFLVVLAMVSLGLALSRLASSPPFLFLSIAFSASLLAVLCRIRNRMLPLTFRVAADAVLLTPILFVPWLLRIAR